MYKQQKCNLLDIFLTGLQFVLPCIVLNMFFMDEIHDMQTVHIRIVYQVRHEFGPKCCNIDIVWVDASFFDINNQSYGIVFLQE